MIGSKPKHLFVKKKQDRNSIFKLDYYLVLTINILILNIVYITLELR